MNYIALTGIITVFLGATLVLAQKHKLSIEKKNEQSTVLRCWSDLPDDIIILISSKIPSCFFDVVSMKGVCSTWRIAMRLRTRMPHLLALSSTPWEDIVSKCRGKCPSTEDKLIISNENFVFSIKDKRRYKLEQTCGIRRRRRIVGSNPNGWLILSDEDKVAYLFHMLLKIRIELPNNVLNINRWEIEFSICNIHKAVLYADDPNRREDFIIVMSYCALIGTRLAFWRYGNSNWTCFGDGGCDIVDIAVCKNKIYAIRYDGSFYLESWDFKNNSTLPEKKLSIPLPCLRCYNQTSHLVIASDDEIFILICLGAFWRYQPYKWDIYKLGSNRNERIKVNSLDGRAFFLSFGDPVILPDIDVEHLGFKPNSIYHIEKKDGRRKLQIGCLDDPQGIAKLNVTRTFCYKGECHPQQPEPLALFLLSI